MIGPRRWPRATAVACSRDAPAAGHRTAGPSRAASRPGWTTTCARSRRCGSSQTVAEVTGASLAERESGFPDDGSSHATHPEDLDVPDATTFSCFDRTTLTSLDDVGLEVTGQLVQPDRAVLGCQGPESDSWCRWCDCQGVPRDSGTRRPAYAPFEWRPVAPVITVRRYRCAERAHAWRQDTAAAEPRARTSRGGPACALVRDRRSTGRAPATDPPKRSMRHEHLRGSALGLHDLADRGARALLVAWRLQIPTAP